jgi:hypothetical protein
MFVVIDVFREGSEVYELHEIQMLWVIWLR